MNKPGETWKNEEFCTALYCAIVVWCRNKNRNNTGNGCQLMPAKPMAALFVPQHCRRRKGKKTFWKNSKKCLTNGAETRILMEHRLRCTPHGGIAQLARAFGSYPKCHRFKSSYSHHRPVGQAAKTPPFHGGNMSSILVRVTKKKSHR